MRLNTKSEILALIDCKVLGLGSSYSSYISVLRADNDFYATIALSLRLDSIFFKKKSPKTPYL